MYLFGYEMSPRRLIFKVKFSLLIQWLRDNYNLMTLSQLVNKIITWINYKTWGKVYMGQNWKNKTLEECLWRIYLITLIHILSLPLSLPSSLCLHPGCHGVNLFSIMSFHRMEGLSFLLTFLSEWFLQRNIAFLVLGLLLSFIKGFLTTSWQVSSSERVILGVGTWL